MNREHHFIIEEAKKYGIEKAILLYNIRFWLDKNKVNNRHIYEKDGVKYVWTYNSSAGFAELFPYMKPRSIARYLSELEQTDGKVISGNFNKRGYDRTKWYTIPTEFGVSTSQNVSIHLPKSEVPITENGQPIPDNKQQIVNTYITYSEDKSSNANNSLVKPVQEHDKMVMLPLSWGDTAYKRLYYVYKALWKHKYATDVSSVNFGKFNRVMKQFCAIYTEYQIAALMYHFFNWRGATDTDTKEYDYLTSRGFAIELMPSKIDIIVAYLKNRMSLPFDDQIAVRSYVVGVLKPIVAQ